MDVTARILSQLPLFAGLQGSAYQQIARYLHERTYEAGQVIESAGEPCQAVYLVVRGVVRTRRLSLEGREYVLDYLSSGDLFNLVPALDGGQTVATVEALSNVTVYLIPCDRFRAMLEENRSLAMAVMKRLAGRIRYLTDRLEDLALHNVRTRLARFLLSRAGDGAQPHRHWTQEEIAGHIGTVRDVVGRTLRSFAREGLVRRQRGRLVVADLGRLQQEALTE